MSIIVIPDEYYTHLRRAANRYKQKTMEILRNELREYLTLLLLLLVLK